MEIILVERKAFPRFFVILFNPDDWSTVRVFKRCFTVKEACLAFNDAIENGNMNVKILEQAQMNPCVSEL